MLVAREVYGKQNAQWLFFRTWLRYDAQNGSEFIHEAWRNLQVNIKVPTKMGN